MFLLPRDLEVLKLLNRYRYLRTSTLHAFVGGDPTNFSKRLGKLFHEGGYLSRPDWQWETMNANYMPVVYELTDAGRRALKENGTQILRHTSGTLHWHELMACEIVANIEAFCNKSKELRFILWQEILNYELFPERSRDKQHPMDLPTSYSFAFKGGKQEGSKAVLPDAVFGIDYGNKQYKFFALEADRGTEPMERPNLNQTSWLRKFLQYRNVIEEKTYKSEWGIPNLLILNVTSKPDQYERIRRKLAELQGKASYHLFKYLPDAGGPEKEGSTLDYLLKPWERVGYEPLNFWQP